MKHRELRFVNGLSLILLGVGLVLILPAAITHYSQVPLEEAVPGLPGITEIKAEKLAALWKPNSYFLKRYILGGVFVCCSLALHLTLRKSAKSGKQDSNAHTTGAG